MFKMESFLLIAIVFILLILRQVLRKMQQIQSEKKLTAMYRDYQHKEHELFLNDHYLKIEKLERYAGKSWNQIRENRTHVIHIFFAEYCICYMYYDYAVILR